MEEALGRSIPLCQQLTHIHLDFREVVFDACPRCMGEGDACMAELVTDKVERVPRTPPLEREE